MIKDDENALSKETNGGHAPESNTQCCSRSIWLHQAFILLALMILFVTFPDLRMLNANDSAIRNVQTHALASIDHQNGGEHIGSQSDSSHGRIRKWPALLDSAKSDNLPSCNFEIFQVNESCPRLVPIWMDMKAGLGHKVLMWLMGFTTALDAGATPIAMMEAFDNSFDHGDYNGFLDFLKIDMNSALEADVRARFPDITTIGERYLAWNQTYPEYIDATQGKCNVMIHVPVDVGPNLKEKRFPQFYERSRHILSCLFLHTNRRNLPQLVFDENWYNVAIHVRVGDISFHGEDKAFGNQYYQKIADQLAIALDAFRTHFHVFSEAPEAGDGPHPDFDYLPRVFGPGDASNEGRRKITFHNAMDAKTTIYNMMNADIIISGGSQFPIVAATLATKAIFLAPREPRADKTGGFHDVSRPETVDLEKDGRISRPETMSELQGLIMTRYAETHDLRVPYQRGLRYV